ncbi:hypothetical protein Tco_0886018, partial [Tanacetum coccineum]
YWNTATFKTVNSEKQIHAIVNDKGQRLPEPFNDTYKTPCHTKKVFTNMARKGAKFPGKVTLLFDSMLVQHQEPKGEGGSERDQVQLTHDSPLSGGHTSDRAEGGLNLDELLVLCTNLSTRVLALDTSKDAQAIEILKLKTRIKKLEKKCKPSISHHKAWLKSMQRLSMKKKLGKKESVSKQGRENAKPRPTLDAFDDLDADLAHGMDYMEIEEAVNKGRQSNKTDEVNTDSAPVSTASVTISTADIEVSVVARPDIDTARPEVHTANAPVSTAGVTISTADPEVSVVEPRTPPTTTSIFDDEDITMAQTLIKMKEEKSKEKGVAFKDVEDSSRPVRSITTLKPLPSIDPKDKGKGVLEEPEPAKKMTRSDFDAAQVARDAEVARQLEVELQAEALYIKEQERAANFVLIGSEEDERLIQKMNKKAAGVHVEEVLKEPNSTKVKVKLEEVVHGTKKTPSKTDKRKIESMNKEDAGESNEKVSDISKKRKGGPRMKRHSKRKKTYFDLEEEGHLKTFLKIVPDKEGIIDFKVLEKRFPIINWESKFYHYDRHGAEGIQYRIFRSDGSSRWIKTFSEMVTRTMFDANAEDELWQNQERWNLKRWNFYENCGVHILTLEDGNEIHMLAERKYPLTKETLERMMSLKLIAESASDSVYDLLRFIQKQIDEARSHYGGDKDL